MRCYDMVSIKVRLKMRLISERGHSFKGSMGAYHSTKNSGAKFRQFPEANGTVFFQCGRR